MDLVEMQENWSFTNQTKYTMKPLSSSFAIENVGVFNLNP